MSGFGTMAVVLFRGTVRDRTSLFFTILFPLIFLIIVGGLFGNGQSPRYTVIQVGPVPVLDALPPDGRAGIGRVLDLGRSDDLAAALARVRDGTAAAVVEQRGDEVVLHTSAADPASAGTVRSVLNSLVEAANLAATGQPAQFQLTVSSVTDASLKPIQYLTPGLLGWAIATGATFTAASTLVSWRQNKLLRRLTFTPVGVPAIIGARVVVSLGLALVQTVVFFAVAALFFGLRLTGDWWLSIPLVLAATLAFLSIGLLAGAKAKTIETSTVVANLIVIPMAFLSGSFFQLDVAPAWVRTIAQVLPLRHLNIGMLDVLARDGHVSQVVPELAILLGFTVVLTAVAAWLFRWEDV
ncbi:ABC transporter permease [Virgisporangium aurantiacum]|uniref:Membrane protein n=1 Tax=Virgisporangium aurantiacum TaxID=175570 RepID=A0A8J4E6P2_9ACTN|nr:ABC transporter permease [Virgisporangium aurantiacum]GIJ64300.1 membrane protein [Virgisporangium aurantiacum]